MDHRRPTYSSQFFFFSSTVHFVLNVFIQYIIVKFISFPQNFPGPSHLLTLTTSHSLFIKKKTYHNKQNKSTLKQNKAKGPQEKVHFVLVNCPWINHPLSFNIHLRRKVLELILLLIKCMIHLFG